MARVRYVAVLFAQTLDSSKVRPMLWHSGYEQVFGGRGSCGYLRCIEVGAVAQ